MKMLKMKKITYSLISLLLLGACSSTPTPTPTLAPEYMIKFNTFSVAEEEAEFMDFSPKDIENEIKGTKKYEELLLEIEQEYQTKINDRHTELVNLINFNFIDNSQLFTTHPNKSVVFITQPDLEPLDPLRRTSEAIMNYNIKNAQFIVSCDRDALDGYSYVVLGCGQSFGIGESVSTIPVTYIVNDKKSFKIKYYPEVQDHKISLYSDGQNIKASNKTDSFLNIKTLSMYVGDNIETLQDLNIEIPPRAVVIVANMQDFHLLELKNVTKLDVQKKLAVGVAIKYVVIDTHKEKTLFKLNNIPLLQHH